jgi:predicted P-loop ATPase
LLGPNGAIRPVRENVIVALDGIPEAGIAGIGACAGLIRFNEFSNNVAKTRPTPWGTAAGDWEESDELRMGDWLVREHWLPSMARATLEEAVLVVAARHAWHPVRQRVERCRGRWDGTPRLATWLRRTCLEEDEYDDDDPLQRYLALVGKWFLMAMVCRVLPVVKHGARTVRGPGTKFDTMLILEGPQGQGKSMLAATLGGEHFADTGLMIGDKDSYQNIQGVLVYEWGELENMSRSEVSKVKLFVSSSKDRFRASFDRRPRDYPRQVVFIGTTNEAHYLTDLTGNRRFWPVRVTRDPDVAWLRENMEQLFAEALVALDAGERFWPDRDEQRELFDPQQRARTIESPLEAEIRAYLYDPNQQVPYGKENGTLVNQIGLSELLTRLGYTIDKQTDAVAKRAGAVMHALGWQVKRTSSPGRPRFYARPVAMDGATSDACSPSTRRSTAPAPETRDGKSD